MKYPVAGSLFLYTWLDSICLESVPHLCPFFVLLTCLSNNAVCQILRQKCFTLQSIAHISNNVFLTQALQERLMLAYVNKTRVEWRKGVNIAPENMLHSNM